MLRNGQQLGALLDNAEEVVKGMETMQTMLVSILEELKSGDAAVGDVEITRDPRTGQVTGVSVNKTE